MKQTNAVSETLRNALPAWNWDDNPSALADMTDFVARSDQSLIVVEDWFARKELDGAQILLCDLEHETEDAILIQNANDVEDRGENVAAFKTHITEAWIPKSVVTGEVRQ